MTANKGVPDADEDGGVVIKRVLHEVCMMVLVMDQRADGC